MGGSAELLPLVEQTLQRAGYRIVQLPRASAPAGLPARTVGERGAHRIPMSRPIRVSVYTLFGTVLALGIFDGLAVGAPIFALPWAAGAGFVALVFWLRYGRTYESDLILVVRGDGAPPGESGSPTSVPTLVWSGARIRSDLRGRTRTISEIEAVPQLAGDLANVVRSFEGALGSLLGN